MQKSQETNPKRTEQRRLIRMHAAPHRSRLHQATPHLSTYASSAAALDRRCYRRHLQQPLCTITLLPKAP